MEFKDFNINDIISYEGSSSKFRVTHKILSLLKEGFEIKTVNIKSGASFRFMEDSFPFLSKESARSKNHPLTSIFK